MPLPDLIEIVPLAQPVSAKVTVPGSKSITNRALILAALAEGETTLHGALWSEDTQVMVECLQELGFMVNVAPDARETCNRTITVYGKGGLVPPGGTEQQPMQLYVGNAGTAARFLAALVCLGKGVYRLHGVPRMHERPQAALLQSLRELGYRVESPNDKLPALIFGAGPQAAWCRVSIEESSQFASALLLCAETGRWEVEVVGQSVEESPYVVMTTKLIQAFPRAGGTFEIEPDASSGSYFWAAGWLLKVPRIREEKKDHGGVTVSIPQAVEVQSLAALHVRIGEKGRMENEEAEFQPVRVSAWPSSGWQIDAAFPDFIPLPRVISRAGQLGDSIMTSIVIGADQDAGRPWRIAANRIEACGLGEPIQFTNLQRLRVQECERVAALRTELTKCGAKVQEQGDTLTVFPAALHGAEIETYGDHRMAMCFAILGLKVTGIRLKNPSCVKKTFPNFYQKLAAPPPGGLGARILDGSGRTLPASELFAE